MSLMVAKCMILMLILAPFLHADDVPGAPAVGSPVRVSAGQSETPRLTEQQIVDQSNFVKRVAGLPPAQIDSAARTRLFYQVVPYYLSPDERQVYFAKCDALRAAGGSGSLKLSGPFSTLLGDPKKAKPMSADSPAALLMAGYKELRATEIQWLMRIAKCTEEQLTKQASLRIVEDMQEGKKVVRYFMHPSDPLFALLTDYRSGRKKVGGTAFFGSGNTGGYCK